MATNMALKRARKAQRRKQVVAERRKVDGLETSLAGRVRRAAQMPIQHCLLAESLFEIGLGTLVLARGPTPHFVTLSAFLIDVFCLGVKDVMVRSVGAEEFAMYIETVGAAAPMMPVEPSYARKLLGDVAAWAQSLGFPPHRDFAVAERMFGDVSAAGCDVDFRFGLDGKPSYMPGPTESASLIHGRIEHLRRTLGDDDFDLDAPL